jgi:hypothetical protein
MVPRLFTSKSGAAPSTAETEAAPSTADGSQAAALDPEPSTPEPSAPFEATNAAAAAAPAAPTPAPVQQEGDTGGATRPRGREVVSPNKASRKEVRVGHGG